MSRLDSNTIFWTWKRGVRIRFKVVRIPRILLFFDHWKHLITCITALVVGEQRNNKRGNLRLRNRNDCSFYMMLDPDTCQHKWPCWRAMPSTRIFTVCWKVFINDSLQNQVDVTRVFSRLIYPPLNYLHERLSRKEQTRPIKSPHNWPFVVRNHR